MGLKEMPISTYPVLFSQSDMEQEFVDEGRFVEEEYTGAARRKIRRSTSSKIATMLSPSAYETSLLQYALAEQDLLKYPGSVEENDELDDEKIANNAVAPRDASESADDEVLLDEERSEGADDSPSCMTQPQDRFEFVKKSAWGRPRGRKTIQDKIAEQERRAAEIERELRSVGLPSSSSMVRGDKPSPSLHKLGKPGIRRTVPVSVIRKSPAVPIPEDEDDDDSETVTPAQASLSDLGTVYARLARNGFSMEKAVASLQHQQAFSLPYMAAPAGVTLMPGVFFRLDGLCAPTGQSLCAMPPMRLDTVCLPTASPSPPMTYSSSHSLHSREAADLSALQRPLREERLSTKLKRIKAVAGGAGEESPRGFLSQKIETLKRRESCLQQEFEEVINTPITRSGISSAQDLRNRVVTAAMIEQRLREPALIQMLRNTADWKRMRYTL